MDIASPSIEFYIFLIENNLEKDQSYKAILSKLKDMNSIRDYEKKSIINAFNDSDYINDLNDALSLISKREHYYKIRNELSSAYRNAEKWYDEYFTEYLRTKGDSGKNWKQTEDDFKVILILVKLNKLDEIDKLEPDLSGRYASFDDNLVHTLAKIICKIGRENSGYNFSDDNLRRLYIWLDNKVDDYIKKNGNELAIQKYMQVCYYKFNRPKFELYLNTVKLSKNNIIYTTTSRKTKEEIRKTKTNRMSYLRYILQYLVNINDLDEFKRITNTIMNYKMTKAERTEAEYTLSRISIDYYQKDYDRTNFESDKSKLKKIKDDLLKEPEKIIKESKILSWSNFINRY